jgi:hypothetical protein
VLGVVVILLESHSLLPWSVYHRPGNSSFGGALELFREMDR